MKWLLLVFALVAPVIAAAALEVEPDSHVIDESGTLRLRIHLSGASRDAELDLTPIERDFEIIGQQTASRFSSINGRIDASTEWTLTLRPRRTGELVIPPLEAGGERSAAVAIEVRPLDATVREQLARQVYFETQTSPERVYVQAQLIYTLRLHYAEGVQLYGELPAEPEIPGAIVQRLADATHRVEMRGGERYGVIEQTFAVFPEQSGPLVIPATSLTASVTFTDVTGRRRRSESKATSAPLSVEVLPIPREYPANAPWLPARRVEILEDWPGGNAAFEVGQPRERAILVRAEGAAASMIPPLEPPYTTTLKTYPDPPQLQDQRSHEGLIGVRTEVASLVPTRPGEIELPGVTLTWWDTTAEVVRTAVLPSRLESVVGIAPPEVAPGPAPADAAADTRPQTPPVAVERAQAADVEPQSGRWGRVEVGAAIVLALLGVITAWTVWRRVPMRTSVANREPRAYRALRAACRRGQPHAIREALDAWLRCRYDTGIDDALAHFTADREARASVDALNAVLYAGAEGPSFQPEPFLRAVRAARRMPKRHGSPLPPLYPAAAVTRPDS